jgi:hypothetical protein
MLNSYPAFINTAVNIHANYCLDPMKRNSLPHGKAVQRPSEKDLFQFLETVEHYVLQTRWLKGYDCSVCCDNSSAFLALTRKNPYLNI